MKTKRTSFQIAKIVTKSPSDSDGTPKDAENKPETSVPSSNEPATGTGNKAVEKKDTPSAPEGQTVKYASKSSTKSDSSSSDSSSSSSSSSSDSEEIEHKNEDDLHEASSKPHEPVKEDVGPDGLAKDGAKIPKCQEDSLVHIEEPGSEKDGEEVIPSTGTKIGTGDFGDKNMTPKKPTPASPKGAEASPHADKEVYMLPVNNTSQPPPAASEQASATVKKRKQFSMQVQAPQENKQSTDKNKKRTKSKKEKPEGIEATQSDGKKIKMESIKEKEGGNIKKDAIGKRKGKTGMNEQDKSTAKLGNAEEKLALCRTEEKSREEVECKPVKAKSKVSKARSACILFTIDQREKVTKEDPELKTRDIMKKLAEAWQSLDKEKRKPYEERAAAEKARAIEERKKEQESKDANHEDLEGEGKTEKKPRKSRKSKAERKPSRPKAAFELFCERTKQQIQDSLGGAEKHEDVNTALGKAWDALDTEKKNAYIKEVKVLQAQKVIEQDELEVEDVLTFAENIGVDNGNETGDLEFVIAKTRAGELVTKRKGMDYTQVEYEDDPSVKKPKVGDEEDEAAADSKELEDFLKKYRSRKAHFDKEVRERSKGGSLDLDDLPIGSPLEMLAFLGNMREDVFPPSNTKLPEPDLWMRVPLLGFCQLVQTVLDGERAGKAALAKKLHDAEEQIKSFTSCRKEE